MLHIFLEYVPGGSIAAVLQKFGSLSEAAVRAYTKQILQGLAYLHAHQIMHRGAPPLYRHIPELGRRCQRGKYSCFQQWHHQACRLWSIQEDYRYVDAALCVGEQWCCTEMLTQYDCKSLKGTPYWMAPEVLNPKPPCARQVMWCCVYLPGHHAGRTRPLGRHLVRWGHSG